MTQLKASNAGAETKAAPKVGQRTMLWLTIDGSPYRVDTNPCATEVAKGAYRLWKLDGTVYDVSEGRYGPTCDCPDFIFRRDGLDPRGCKHIRALVGHKLIATR